MIATKLKSLYLRHETVRFVLAGATNTGLTLAIYWLVLNWLSYPVAYSVSFVSGVLSSYALNTYVVFRASWSWTKLLIFPSVHVVNYACGMAVMWLCIQLIGLSQLVAPIVATLAVLPINFLMTRRLMKGCTTESRRSV